MPNFGTGRKNMENDHEVDRVLMNIKNSAGTVASLVCVQAQCAILLFQFLYRLYKEKKLKPREFDNMQKFIKKTKGDYTIVNVPRTKTLTEGSLQEDLNRAGVSFIIMPDVNKKDGMFQVAIYEPDKAKFEAVYNRNLMANMQGGKKSLQELQAVTQGSVSIVSVPLEGKKDVLEHDFDALKINYGILPDLKVGDGEIQAVVADVDLPKVQHWFDLYKKEQLATGNEVEEMTVMNQQQYAATGAVTEEEYIQNADEEFKEATEKYEGKEKGSLERDAMRHQYDIRTTADEAYEVLHNDPKYEEITINEKSLVGNSKFAQGINDTLPNFFASRVPGTYGNSEQTLVLPSQNVFSTDNGKTYIAFLERDKKPIMLDSNKKRIPMEQRPTGAELYATYDEVLRRFKNGKKQSAELDKEVAPDQMMQQLKEPIIDRVKGENGVYIVEDVEKTVKEIKAPSVPMKIK